MAATVMTVVTAKLRGGVGVPQRVVRVPGAARHARLFETYLVDPERFEAHRARLTEHDRAQGWVNPARAQRAWLPTGPLLGPKAG